MNVKDSPFHSGEVEAQQRVGVTDLAERVGGFIRDHMPDQHRHFFASLPFIVVAGADQQQQPWITAIDGKEGFIRSPDAKRLLLNTTVDSSDPLATAFNDGTSVGMVGIKLATRRRNRMNGFLQPTVNGYSIDVGQSFGNCPQYINEREWRRVEANPLPPMRSKTLSAQQMELINVSDTLFIGSGHHERTQARANGYDASHRGGKPGFVQVINNTHLRIPDYAGNNFFNTIGNLLNNPNVALLFIDFQSGSLLHLSGEAQIDWDLPSAIDSLTTDTGAQRFIDITIHKVIERPGALGLRWQSHANAARQLTLLKKVPESESITSFYFTATDRGPLAPFKAGQHLPVKLQLPQPHGKVIRTYSLSAASNGETYRVSVKREDQGLVSRYMHDTLAPGDTIEAGTPTGDFILPSEQTPVVLVSAGVGITPLLAMLKEISQSDSNRPVWFLHSAQNGSVHAMGDEVRALTSATIKTRVFYTQPHADNCADNHADDHAVDRAGVDFDVKGRITTKDLLNLHAGDTAHYLLCGPTAFVATLQGGLEAAGVPVSQIHFETF